MMFSYEEMRMSKLYPYVYASKKGWNLVPMSLQIGTTHACVNRCVMCQHWTRPQAGSLSIINVEYLFRNVIEPFANLGGESICYSGGEAMEHPEMIDILKGTVGHGITTGLITSGTGKAFDGDISILSKLEWVRLSLDAVDQTVYKKSRGPGYDQAMDSLSEMIGGGVKIGFGITVHKHNLEHIPELTMWILEHVPYEQIESIRYWIVRGEKSLEPEHRATIQVFEKVKEIFLEYDAYEELSTNLTEVRKRIMHTNMLPELPGDAAYTRCAVPIVHIYIDASLRGFPCCAHAGDAESKPIAPHVWDFNKQSLRAVAKEIYKREQEKFDYAKGNEEACKNCMLRLYTINKVIGAVDSDLKNNFI